MSDPGVELELAGMLVGLGETRDDPALRRRTGTVTAVSGASYSVSIGGTVVAGVRSLVPLVVGDVAEIVFDGPRPLAVGHVDTGWHYVGDAGEPVFYNGGGSEWGNYGTDGTASWAPLRFRKSSGIVYVQGLVTGGSFGVGWPIFFLPAGYRPSYALIFASVTSPDAIGRLSILADGQVIAWSGNNAWFMVDAVFPAEQ